MTQEEFEAWVAEQRVEAVIEHCSRIDHRTSTTGPFDTFYTIRFRYGGQDYGYSIVDHCDRIGAAVVHRLLKLDAAKHLLQELGVDINSHSFGSGTQQVYNRLTKERY